MSIKKISIFLFILIFIQSNVTTTLKCNHNCDLIVFSYKRPMQLYALLESLQEYVVGLDRIMVLYRTDDNRYEQAYEIVKKDFTNVSFIQQSKYNPHSDFKPLFMNLLTSSDNDYILFATDDNLVKDYIAIADCILHLEQTHAYGFYLRLGKNLNYCYPMHSQQEIPFLTSVNKSICAWQFRGFASYDWDWAYPNTVDMTIYNKREIINTLHSINFNNPNTLEGNWAQLANQCSTKTGLCFKQSKIVNIPMNRVQDVSQVNRSMEHDPQELLELFEQGFKINRKPFHQWQNCSAHAESEFIFIPR